MDLSLQKEREKYNGTNSITVLTMNEKRRPDKKKKSKKPAGKKPEIEDFYADYLGKKVKIRLSSGETLEGTILDTTRFFYKVFLKDARVLIINKGHVLYVELEEPPSREDLHPPQ